MGNPLRDLRAPSELAASGQLIEFTEKLSNFEHLARIVEADLLALDPAKLPPDWRDSIVAGQLAFSVASAHEGVPVLEGQVTATVDAVCQRCLEPFRVPLDVQLRLAFPDNCDSGDEYGDYEVWELAEETLRPLGLVEEALIMAIPFSTMHIEAAACGRQEVKTSGAKKTSRPFAELKAQMENKN